MRRQTLAQLQSQRDSLRERNRIVGESKKLEREIRDLKNPKSVAFRKNLKSGLIKGGRATLKYLDDLTRPVPMRRAPTKKKKRR